MSLKQLLQQDSIVTLGGGTVHEDITPDVIRDDLSGLRRVIAYWRVYPDKFVDYLCSLNPNNTFKFYFYQRVYLRCMMRYRHVYLVCPRGFSKSFLAVLALMLKCILYPRCSIFVVSSGKEQSAGILLSKMQEICKLIPALEKEIVWDTRKDNTARTRSTRDSVVYTFKNGSSLENIALTEKTRGRRFQSGLIEEAASLDNQDILNEVVLPQRIMWGLVG